MLWKTIMVNYNIKISNGSRNDVIEYIQQNKKMRPFKVVDVGGSHGGWSINYVDAIVDFNDFSGDDNLKIQHFKCDITHPDSWNELLLYVEKNGKFDFCICTHTLEDIMNPVYVSEQIQKIAKEGYIAVPSKYRELSRFECRNNRYRGHIHHRWIFDIIDNIFVGFPKINYLDSTNIFDKISNFEDNKKDLSFFWKDTIDIKYINNNYLGPCVDSVMSYYNLLFQNKY
jgi:hypothetical protein